MFSPVAHSIISNLYPQLLLIFHGIGKGAPARLQAGTAEQDRNLPAGDRRADCTGAAATAHGHRAPIGGKVKSQTAAAAVGYATQASTQEL
jgi:hypothetical protein